MKTYKFIFVLALSFLFSACERDMQLPPPPSGLLGCQSKTVQDAIAMLPSGATVADLEVVLCNLGKNLDSMDTRIDESQASAAAAVCSQVVNLPAGTVPPPRSITAVKGSCASRNDCLYMFKFIPQGRQAMTLTLHGKAACITGVPAGPGQAWACCKAQSAPTITTTTLRIPGIPGKLPGGP